MSVIRLIMVENDQTFSGHIPSSSISAVLWAIAQGSKDTESFWQTVAGMDPGLNEHFFTNKDDSPLLEGYDDGLLVISWEYQCIESFQVYQPLRHHGSVIKHTGSYLDEEAEAVDFAISNDWSIIDHHFEESRH